MADSVDEILERTKIVSTDEEDFKKAIEGKTIETFEFGPSKMLMETEGGEVIEIGIGFDDLKPNIVTDHNPDLL